jgi:hypothetical protein
MTIGTSPHAKQIRGVYGSLYDQLKGIDLDMCDLDIDFVYNPDGSIASETVTDISVNPAVVIKFSEYAYLVDGSIDTETVVKGSLTYKKTFEYEDGKVVSVAVRKVVT